MEEIDCASIFPREGEPSKNLAAIFEGKAAQARSRVNLSVNNQKKWPLTFTQRQQHPCAVRLAFLKGDMHATAARLCVFEREKERNIQKDRDRERERQREKQRERERVCVCGATDCAHQQAGSRSPAHSCLLSRTARRWR